MSDDNGPPEKPNNGTEPGPPDSEPEPSPTPAEDGDFAERGYSHDDDDPPPRSGGGSLGGDS